MVDGALHIVEPWSGGSPEQWDLALECKGLPPKPDERLESYEITTRHDIQDDSNTYQYHDSRKSTSSGGCSPNPD